ncbi:choice-of-anchor L domain-containing protein, partial [Flavobacterium antarcticum]
LYEDLILGNCQPPSCPKPTNLLVTSVSQTSVTASWTETGSAPQWEVYAVVEGGTPPVNGAPLNTGVAGYSLATSNVDFPITNLLPGTKYQYYVRAICSATDISNWTLLTPKSFITKPANDECSAAINVPVNLDRTCTQTVSGSTLGGTTSAQVSTCPGTKLDDVWYSFVATNNIHIVSIFNIVGSTATTNVRYTIYGGVDCGSLTQLYCSSNNINSAVVGGLVSGETYKIRIYSTAPTASQFATFSICITTPAPITNDECATATPAFVNNGLSCAQVTAGSITGATASPESSSCAGLEDDDVWFSFVATSPKHIITFQNIVGTSLVLNSALYSGDICGNLTFIACNNNNETIVNNLTPGTTYKIRVWSNSGQLEDIRFDLCIGSIVPPITVSTTQYTNSQLVTDVLIKSTCATVTNITWATGTAVNTNGIGYFERGQSDFPFENGIVLVTGSATAAVGPNNSTLGNGGLGGDADLSAILAAQDPPQNGTLNNATKLEFDFVAINDKINFEFLFASEEYGIFQCDYSDAFAFILTDVTAGTPAKNLAIIPGSNPPIPVSVVNIRNSENNANCPSANEEFFDKYYNNPAGVIGAPINFNGVTIPMLASSSVIPGNTYHIKMVIADYNDGSYDSAVFLKGDSFDIGNITLPDDYLIADGTALCNGDDVTLDSQLDPTLYDIQWYNGDTLLPGEINPTLVVTQTGTYNIHAAYVGTSCVTIDSIVVEYFVDSDAPFPADLALCDASGQGMFDLTVTKDEILAPFPAGSHEIMYFLTEADAQNNTITAALTEAEAQAFLGTDGQEIFVRVNFLTTSCFQVVSFKLIVQDLTPQFTLTGNMAICPDEPTTITIVPTNNNFNVNAVTYEWTFNSNVIPTATTNALQIAGQSGYGIYTVTVNNSGCSFTETFEIVPSTENWQISFVGEPYVICTGESTTLAFTAVNFDIDNANATYTWTSPSNVTGEGKTFSANEVGTYTLSVDIFGCVSTFDVDVAKNNLAIEIDFTQGCNNNAYQLVAVPFNGSFDISTSSFLWTGP